MYRFYAKNRFAAFCRNLVAAGLTTFVFPAAAHDFWIEPTFFDAAPGTEIPIVLRVGEDLAGDTVPYINDWFSDYRVVMPSGSEPIAALLGDDPAGRFIAGEAGLYLIGYRSSRDFVELQPEKFDSYLRNEGLENIIERRAALSESERPARELYSRCAKSLVRVGDGIPDEVYRRQLGYTLELIPERNPYTLAPGELLPVTLQYLGEPLEGILIIAFEAAAASEKIALRTDANGRVLLPLDRSGLWLIKAVHMIRTGQDVKRAEWESFWASLTFRLPAGNPDN